MLSWLRRTFWPRRRLSPDEMAYVRSEHSRLSSELKRKESALETVRCSRCVYEEDPKATRLLAEIRALRRTIKGAERLLGE